MRSPTAAPWCFGRRSAGPGGTRLPSDWALFDVLANEWEMCLDGPLSSEPFESKEPR
jgi:hypothetical protein